MVLRHVGTKNGFSQMSSSINSKRNPDNTILFARPETRCIGKGSIRESGL